MAFGGIKGSALMSDNVPGWWDESKKQEIEAFKDSCHNLSLKLLSCLALAMGQSLDFFDAAHDPLVGPGDVLRLIYYPALSQKPDASFPRLYPHTDWGSLTLLFAASAGSEVQSPRAGWAQVPMIPGSIIVNIADAVQLWSGNLFKSTMHKISWDNLPYDKTRYSIAYFVNANQNAPLQMLSNVEAEGAVKKPKKLKEGITMKIITRFGCVLPMKSSTLMSMKCLLILTQIS